MQPQTYSAPEACYLHLSYHDALSTTGPGPWHNYFPPTVSMSTSYPVFQQCTRKPHAYIHTLPTVLVSCNLVALGVRARQEGVVFVMCEDEELIDGAVRPLLGSWVSLEASAGGVTISAAEKPDGKNATKGSGAQDAARAEGKSAKASPIKMVCNMICC